MNQKRSRGRPNNGRKPHGMGTQRNFDSNGPDVKIRGTAAHIFERYCQLARDAHASGDRVSAESYQQHAEHYYRIMVAHGLHQQQRHPQNSQHQHQNQPSMTNGEGMAMEEGAQPAEADAQPSIPAVDVVG